jgi:hypothetical protein
VSHMDRVEGADCQGCSGQGRLRGRGREPYQACSVSESLKPPR